jgi:hypothetical protein
VLLKMTVKQREAMLVGHQIHVGASKRRNDHRTLLDAGSGLAVEFDKLGKIQGGKPETCTIFPTSSNLEWVAQVSVSPSVDGSGDRRAPSFLVRSREPAAGHRFYLGTTLEVTPHPSRRWRIHRRACMRPKLRLAGPGAECSRQPVHGRPAHRDGT